MYIGKEPQVGNYQVCDAISVVNGQAAYTMQVGSVNVSPESANHMIVSLNGVIQKPGSSFTISGSTITFSSNLATGDSIDFIYLLGNVLDVGVPSDATVTTAKVVDNAITLAKMASGTDGNIISYDASGNPVAVATGNDGQVLTSTGAGSPPAFEDAGGGAWNLISTTTISNAATTIITGMDSTYNVYCFQVHDLKVANSGQEITLRYQIGGAIKTDGKYDYVACRANAAPSDNLNTGGTGNDTAEIQLLYDAQAGNAAEASFSSTIFMFNPSGTALRKLMRHSSVFYNSGGAIAQVDGCGAYNNSNAAVTGLQFYSSGGANIASGKIKLYGIS